MTNLVIYTLLTGIIVLVIWRITGYSPLMRPEVTASNVLATEPAPYSLLATMSDNIVYFDRQSGQITQNDLTGATYQSLNDIRFHAVLVTASKPYSNTFVIIASTTPNRANLYLINLAEDPILLQLTKEDNGFPPLFMPTADSLLSWSPDGSQVAFTAFEGENADLFLVDAAGKQVNRLTYHQAHISSLLWLDNKTISFVWDWNGQDAIYKIDHDGGNLTQIK